MSRTDCPTCGGPALCWADRSGGITVNFRCLTATCPAGKGPWDTPEPDVNTPSKARIARDVRITTDANTNDLLAIRADGDAPEHIRNAAIAELDRRGYATWWVHDQTRPEGHQS